MVDGNVSLGSEMRELNESFRTTYCAKQLTTCCPSNVVKRLNKKYTYRAAFMLLYHSPSPIDITLKVNKGLQ